MINAGKSLTMKSNGIDYNMQITHNILINLRNEKSNHYEKFSTSQYSPTRLTNLSKTEFTIAKLNTLNKGYKFATNNSNRKNTLIPQP